MALKLNRSEYRTVEAYLFHLYNDLGCVDLEVAYNYKTKDNGIGFSKWVRFDLLMFLDYNEAIPGTFDTKESFLSKATHRSILDVEVLLDFDETPYGSTLPEDIKKYASTMCKKFSNLGFSFESFFSGSKSVHCSFIFPQLRSMDKHTRERFKKHFMIKYGADLQKSSNRTMIAMEGVPHWKTGVVKEEFNYERY